MNLVYFPNTILYLAEMVDGYTMWKLHRAVKLHLLTEKYDVFKSNGRVKNTELERFLKSNDKKIFELLGKHFEKPQDAIQFFVANIAYTGKDEMYDSAMAWENYLLWVKHKESLTKLILDDLDILDVKKDLQGNPPRLLQGILAGKILPETAVAINRYKPFIKEWKKQVYFGSGHFPCIIDKLDKFVKFNEVTISNALEQQYVS